MTNKQRAGNSAAAEHRKRVAARSRSQQFAALFAVVVATVVLCRFLGVRNGIVIVSVLTIAFSAMYALNRRKHGVPDAWRRGSIGEQRTAERLRQLPRNYTVFHDVALAGSRANIDHIVLGPTGIFVLDSKNWRKSAVLTKYGWKYGVLLEQTAKVTAAESQWVASGLDPERSRWSVPVYTAWVMTEARQPIDRISDVDIVALDDLSNYITEGNAVLTGGRLRRLVAHGEELFRAR